MQYPASVKQGGQERDVVCYAHTSAGGTRRGKDREEKRRRLRSFAKRDGEVEMLSDGEVVGFNCHLLG